MARVLRYVSQEGRLIGRSFLCPGCGNWHVVNTTEKNHNGAMWGYNGNDDSPTFTPSINSRLGPWPDGRIEICHFFVRDGKIQFLTDCSHDKKGLTLDLPEIKPEPSTEPE